jgi:hypothetical protein
MSQTVSWSRQVPVRYEADVAVIGGGIAGTCAAVAAAQSGVSVILVERFAITGGDMTSGGVSGFCGETAGQGRVFDEIVAGLEAFNAINPYYPYEEKPGRGFDHEILAIVLQELLLRHGVKLLLHTRFVDTLVSDIGEIRECIVCGQSGPEALRAKQYIDCSGEGQLAHQAGFDSMKGRPGDGYQLPMSFMAFVRELDEPGDPQVPEGWFEAIRSEDDLPMVSPWPNGPKSLALKIKIPMFDSTDTEGMTNAEIRARRRVMEVLDYYQRVEGKRWKFDHNSPIIGIREGRRIVGDYVLSVDDLRAGRAFDDGVARGTFYLDGHKPDDDKRTYILPKSPGPLSKSELQVPPYQIPLRSLIARDGTNIQMAGRCFSADQLALSSARVATSSAMMGQAAGITAAMSVLGKCNPRDIDPADVRREVVARAARLDV